uniref:Uncharacterized protein n=1 Tax=Oryza meridionalis TaxID=40149 RepID=A0A0E0C653_9ORYZ
MAVIKILQTPVTPTARDVPPLHVVCSCCSRPTWQFCWGHPGMGSSEDWPREHGVFRKGLHSLEAAKIIEQTNKSIFSLIPDLLLPHGLDLPHLEQEIKRGYYFKPKPNGKSITKPPIIQRTLHLV